MGLEKVEYHNVLNEKFYRFKNFFVDGAPTKEMISMFLALDKNYFYSMGREKYKIFQGKTRSLLFDIFSHNGYETNTSYDSGYFGRGAGPYVDNYLVRTNSAICNFIPDELKYITFFGYCELMSKPRIKELMSIYFPTNSQTTFGFIIDKFQKGLSKSKIPFSTIFITK